MLHSNLLWTAAVCWHICTQNM